MSGRFARWCGALCSLVCGACVAAGAGATTPVIVAGSVCSGQPGIDTALARTPGTPPAAPLVAWVSDGTPSELSVYDMTSGRVRFRVPAELKGRPQILQDVVVATDAHGQLVGFDLVTGARRFSVPVERASWLGAVQVGRSLIFTSTSLSFRPGERGSTVTAVDARSGARIWERRVPYTLSAPSLVGETVLMLSDHADVWALQARSGSDSGCTRLAEPTDWLAANAGGALLGTHDARRLPAAGSGERLKPPVAELPSRPMLHVSSYDAVPAAHSAHGRVGVIAGFTAQPAPQLAGDRYYFVFYREVFAYAADGQLAWARLLDADVVRADASAEQLVLLGEDGSLRRLDPTSGAELQSVRLPATRIASGDLSLGGAGPSAPPPAAAAPARPLRDTLLEIALDTDARLLPGRLLALSLLAALPEPLVTQDLLRIYTQPGVPVALRERIEKLMPTRRTGSEYLVDALLEDYDFLEDRSPPPLAAIVPALVATHETRAVPRLVERLFDPDTRLSELVGLVDAIAALGDAAASEPLARFLAMYHADSSLSEDAAALIAAARALHARDRSHGALLQALSEDASTLPALRSSLSGLLQPPAADAPSPAPNEVARANPSDASLPERLSDEALQHAFATRADDLRTCSLEELSRNPNLRALRLSVVVQSDGGFSGLSVLPDHPALLQCLQSRLSNLRFPAFRGPRRLASYSVAVHPNADLALAQPTEASGRAFWKPAEWRAGPVKIPNQAPWWQDQNPLFVAVDDAPKAAPTSDETTPAPSAKAPTAPAKPAANEPKAQPAETPPEDAWWLPAK